MNHEIHNNVTCAACGTLGLVNRIIQTQVEMVRHVSFEVVKTVRKCASCGAQFENSRDPDWRTQAYHQFRVMHDWVTPMEITNWRNQHQFDVTTAADVIGISSHQLARIENGALQSSDQNQLLDQVIRQ
jgi:DNA-binding XRE family transcriptional regulator